MEQIVKKKSILDTIGDFFKNIGKKIVSGFKNFGLRFKNGSLGTKMSHFIMGSGNFYHKRYIKGVLYLLIQIGFILIMVLTQKLIKHQLVLKR